MFRLSNLIKSTLEDTPSRSLNGAIAIWNFTNRCNLTCRHCYSYADPNSKDFLSTQMILDTIPELTKAGVKFVIFSGGEPLIRRDIFEIAKSMREAGIITYLSTNGLYISEKNVKKIIETFNYIGISIDGIGKIHDEFRGLDGAFDRSIEAIKLIQANGGSAGVRFTLTKETQDSFYDIFELAEKIDVNKIYISHLVYSGRGLDNLKIDITKEQRREFVKFIIQKAFEYYENGKDIDIVTGNMEMDSIIFIEEFAKRYPKHREKLIQKLKKWGGNSAGRNLVNINHLGDVKPDPFFPFVIGNITQKPFSQIWKNEDDELLQRLREFPRRLNGVCKNCKVIDICNGGSRSRAWAISGNLWDEDPSCYLSESERNLELGE